MKYPVTVKETQWIEMVVEADSKKEAEDKALDYAIELGVRDEPDEEEGIAKLDFGRGRYEVLGDG